MLKCILLFAIYIVLAYAAGKDETIQVPACPDTSSVSFTTSVPNGDPCPKTQVDICYTDKSLKLLFTASNETNFYYNPSHQTNDNIWAYEAMEAFISKGLEDPQTYLEYEVSPNNQTFNAFIYNPSRESLPGQPMDHAYISSPFSDGFQVNTQIDKPSSQWKTESTIPLALFNGEHPKSSVWRMNFFRTITGPDIFPKQKLCAWRNPGKANFHITPVFGVLSFV
ncbi:hypothetical protein IWW36_000410 [Coemansia brasiliensis]|uniref:Uncharacterized protein n=1 Tax=Coemansia brasiliensis TaxID=2650707 RepID=A0A9W8M2J4_9FUNG|nr:hypothetical protein IWW36_000410 [Coemansia brasiliensis]